MYNFPLPESDLKVLLNIKDNEQLDLINKKVSTHRKIERIELEIKEITQFPVHPEGFYRLIDILKIKNDLIKELKELEKEKTNNSNDIVYNFDLLNIFIDKDNLEVITCNDNLIVLKGINPVQTIIIKTNIIFKNYHRDIPCYTNYYFINCTFSNLDKAIINKIESLGLAENISICNKNKLVSIKVSEKDELFNQITNYINLHKAN